MFILQILTSVFSSRLISMSCGSLSFVPKKFQHRSEERRRVFLFPSRALRVCAFLYMRVRMSTGQWEEVKIFL